MKQILMLLDNPFRPDYRVLKEAESLIDRGYQVKILAVKHPNFDQVQILNGITIERFFNEDFFSRFQFEKSEQFQGVIDKLKEENFDFLHCHDYLTIHIGAYLKQKSIKNFILVYDAHEYISGYPIYKTLGSAFLKLKGFIVWKIQVKREMKSFNVVNEFITVGNKIGQRYQNQHKIKQLPYIIRNVPALSDIGTPIEKGYFNKKLGIPEDKKIIIHTSSIPYSEERFRMLIDTVREIKEVVLLFIINDFGRQKLQSIFSKSEIEDIVYFHDYVSNSELIGYLSAADIGFLFTWRPKWQSYWLSLGNRVFELGFAGLPLLSTRQPEFEVFCKQYQHGALFDGNDAQQLKEAILDILHNYDHYKKNAEHIKFNESWEQEAQKLLELYDKYQ